LKKLIWTDELSIGHAIIDGQHRQLVDLYNTLCDYNPHIKSGSSIDDILDALAKYIEVHFATEEQLMFEEDYPGLHAHKSEHDDFFIQIYRIRNEIKKNLGKGVSELQNFLNDWLFNSHLQSHDKILGRFLANERSDSILGLK